MCICGCGSAKNYRKLADLRLRNTSCCFAVAELSINLRCPALVKNGDHHQGAMLNHGILLWLG